MTREELYSLNINQIEIALLDQRDLYSEEEIEELTHRLEILKSGNEAAIKEDLIKHRPETFRCPKCDGINKSINEICEYCGYVMKEKDYDNEEIEAQTENDVKTSNTSLYVIAFILPFIGIILGIIYIGKNEELGKSLILFSIVAGILSMIIYYLFLFP